MCHLSCLGYYICHVSGKKILMLVAGLLLGLGFAACMPVAELPEPVSSTPDSTAGPDAAVSNGNAAITQYYAFLGQGRYEEAYRLLSPAARMYPLDEYSKHQKSAFKVVRVISIDPFAFQPNPYRPTADLSNCQWFSVTIYAEGEGGWSGSKPNGEQSFYVAVIREDGLWKIDRWATGIAP
jgi:hypothetical protein